MKLMFKKSYDELKALLSGIEGVWDESQNNKKVLRLNGGVMNWYESCLFWPNLNSHSDPI